MAVNTNTIVSNVYAQNYTPGSKEKTKVARNTETGAEFKEATEEKVNKSIETLRKNKADLQKEFDELSSSIVEHTFVGQGRLIKAFPDMKHRDYLEVVQELKNKMRDRK